MNSPKDAKKFTVKLLSDERIQIRPDTSTVVTRKVRESDRTDYPELFAASDSPIDPAVHKSDELAAKKLAKEKKAAAKAAQEAALNESQADS